MVGLPRGIVTTWDTIAVRPIAYRHFFRFQFCLLVVRAFCCLSYERSPRCPLATAISLSRNNSADRKAAPHQNPTPLNATK